MNLERIQAYINCYSGNGGESAASTKYLLREWRRAKKPLFKMIGITDEEYENEDIFWNLPDERFVLEKDIEYAASEEKLKRQFMDACGENDSILYTFRKKYIDFINSEDFKNTLVENGGEASTLSLWALERLAHLKCLYYGTYEHQEYKYPFIGENGKKYTIALSKGSKTSKMLRKVVAAYMPENLKECDDFLTKLSLLKNQKSLKGTLCVSVHPLDYMTASDNKESWSSCMSWINDGCYRRGTVEMMDSPIVYCVYLKSHNNEIEFRNHGVDYTWNSKKWRQWIIFDPKDGIMTTVKGYPYQNDKLDNAVLDTLQDLDKNNAWGETLSFERDDTVNTPNGRYCFETDVMYNDFGNGNESHYRLCGGERHSTTYINFSGQAVCMNCGELEDSRFNDSEGVLICDECDGDGREMCANCEGRYYTDDMYELDGAWYCQDCYENYVMHDTVTDEDHHRDNMTTVHLVDDTDEEYDENRMRDFDIGEDAYVYDLAELSSHVYNEGYRHYCLLSEVEENNERYAFQQQTQKKENNCSFFFYMIKFLYRKENNMNRKKEIEEILKKNDISYYASYGGNRIMVKDIVYNIIECCDCNHTPYITTTASVGEVFGLNCYFRHIPRLKSNFVKALKELKKLDDRLGEDDLFYKSEEDIAYEQRANSRVIRQIRH